VKVTRIRAGQYQIWEPALFVRYGMLTKSRNSFRRVIWCLTHRPDSYDGPLIFATLREAKAYLIEYYNQEKKCEIRN